MRAHDELARLRVPASLRVDRGHAEPEPRLRVGQELGPDHGPVAPVPRKAVELLLRQAEAPAPLVILELPRHRRGPIGREIQVRLQLLPRQQAVRGQRIRDQVQGTVGKVDDTLSALDLQIGFMYDVALGDPPRPRRLPRRIALDGVLGALGKTAADYLQRPVRTFRGQRPVKRPELLHDPPERHSAPSRRLTIAPNQVPGQRRSPGDIAGRAFAKHIIHVTSVEPVARPD